MSASAEPKTARATHSPRGRGWVVAGWGMGAVITVFLHHDNRGTDATVIHDKLNVLEASVDDCATTFTLHVLNGYGLMRSVRTAKFHGLTIHKDEVYYFIVKKPADIDWYY